MTRVGRVGFTVSVLFALAALGCAIYALIVGETFAATTLSLNALTGVVCAFVFRRT